MRQVIPGMEVSRKAATSFSEVPHRKRVSSPNARTVRPTPPTHSASPLRQHRSANTTPPTPLRQHHSANTLRQARDCQFKERQPKCAKSFLVWKSPEKPPPPSRKFFSGRELRLRILDPSGRHRQLTPPTHSTNSHRQLDVASPLRQPNPPSYSAKLLRQVTPPSHSAKLLRQVAPPSCSAKLLRQVASPTCSEHWLRLDRSRGSTAIPQTLAGDGLALRTSPGTRGRTPPNSPVSGDFGHRPGSPLFQLTDDPRNSIPDFQMAPRENQSQEPPTHASVTLNPRCHSLLT